MIGFVRSIDEHAGPCVAEEPMEQSRVAETAHAYWDTKAAEYESLIRRAIPGYDAIVATLLDTMPDGCGRVLELGCGTGNLSLRLLDRFPQASFTLVDAASSMLEIAAARVAATGPVAAERVTFVAARFEDLELETGGHDAVVASFSLHHLADLAPLYGRARRWLAPGGVLRNADAFAGPTPQLHAYYMHRWESFWREPGNLGEDEIRSLDEHVRAHDHYFDLASHFRWLDAAGFTAFDCVWRDGLMGVIAAE
jgi:ubiquinone/menaquinone biosynthesis C-methylase UbiE